MLKLNCIALFFIMMTDDLKLRAAVRGAAACVTAVGSVALTELRSKNFIPREPCVN